MIDLIEVSRGRVQFTAGAGNLNDFKVLAEDKSPARGS